MSVIRANKDNEEVTCIQPDKDTESIIEDLKKRGYTNIRDVETVEKY